MAKLELLGSLQEDMLTRCKRKMQTEVPALTAGDETDAHTPRWRRTILGYTDLQATGRKLGLMDSHNPLHL